MGTSNLSGTHVNHCTAQMGPSGSGKTTLLDVLAGRKTAGHIVGNVLFEGVKPSTVFLRRFTGYVEQFGAVLPLDSQSIFSTSAAHCGLHVIMVTIDLQRLNPKRSCMSRAAEPAHMYM